jgi:hypothetical protein
VIQASQLGELDDAGLRAERFRVGCDRPVAAEQAARRAAGRCPAGFERDFLGAADGRAVAGAAEGVRPPNDLLQPLCAMAQGRGTGPHSGRGHNRLRRQCADDRQHLGARASACRQLKKATRIAVWAARAAG